MAINYHVLGFLCCSCGHFHPQLGRGSQTQEGYGLTKANSMSGSRKSVRSGLSGDVQELMEELGIADPIEEEALSGRNSSAKTDQVRQ